MKKIIPAIIILLFVMTLVLCSCTPKDPYIDNKRDDTPLQVYLLYWNSYEKDVIQKYNREIDEGNIDGRKIEITEFQFEEIENLYHRISNEVMSGDGPDIIFVDEILSSYLDLRRMAEQDAFADFDILIEKSETFSLDDYNKDALDTGIINEKRIIIPLSFRVNYLVSTQENFDDIGISVPDYLTYQNFFEIIEKCHNEPDLIGALYPLDVLLCNAISGEGIDTQEIDLKKYMDLEVKDSERTMLLGGISGGLVDFYQYTCNGDILMNYSRNTGGDSGEFAILYNLYNIIENFYDKTFVMLNDPAINTETSYGYIETGCIININSKHKNDAFKFIEFILSEQCQYGDTCRVFTIPVNNAAYESAKSDFMNDVFIRNNSDYSSTPLPTEIKDSYISLVEGVSEYKYIGGERYILTQVINDSIDAYINNKIDFDTMVEEINRKIELYYSE